MKTNILLVLVLCLIALNFSSCVKVKGCKDENAENYDADVTEDDGSCHYEGSYIFWFTMTEGYQLSSDGVEELNFFVDDVLIETTGTYSYFYTTPSCSDEAAVYISRELDGGINSSFQYSVTDEDDNVLYSGTGSFQAGKCKKIELQ